MLKTTGDALTHVVMQPDPTSLGALAFRTSNLTHLEKSNQRPIDQSANICAVVRKAVRLRRLEIQLVSNDAVWRAASQIPG